MDELQLLQFESGRLAKPDRLEAGLAHKIGAALLEIGESKERIPRFNVRVNGSYDFSCRRPTWIISGEVSDFVLNNDLTDLFYSIAFEHYNHLHPTRPVNGIGIQLNLKPQASPLATNFAAGDEGNPIAVAFAHGPNYLPWERFLAVGIRKLIDDIYHDQGRVPIHIACASGVDTLEGLHADGKISVGCLYDGVALRRLEHVTVSVEHEEKLPVTELRDKLSRIIQSYINTVSDDYLALLERLSSRPKEPLRSAPLVINPLGAWNEGGLFVDDGISEAKPQEDYFGPYGCMEDSPWGEDPTKPSGTGTIAARNAAVHVVAAGLALFAKVSLHYTIGKPAARINVTTGNTARIAQSRLERWVSDTCPLSLFVVAEQFGLQRPERYLEVARDCDHFHNPEFPWNVGK